HELLEVRPRRLVRPGAPARLGELAAVAEPGLRVDEITPHPGHVDDDPARAALGGFVVGALDLFDAGHRVASVERLRADADHAYAGGHTRQVDVQAVRLDGVAGLDVLGEPALHVVTRVEEQI